MPSNAIVFGFGFGNLAMLGWLAAAAAPLLIHLWSRRRYRETPWAAMTFLMAAVRRNSRRIRLEQWLLLAVRTLLILLVVLAVAEPYGEQIGSSGAPTHRILVIDTSFSMGYREGDATRLANAKRLASEIVENSGASDVFTVITLANPPRQIVGRDVVDHRAVAERVAASPTSDGAANLDATLDLVTAALALMPAEAERIQRQEVYFFTDLQRLTWSPAGAADGDVRQSLATIAERARLELVDVGLKQASNLAVTDIGLGEPFVTAGRPATLMATLCEFGDQSRDDCVVEFLVDGVPVGQQSVHVAAGGEVAVRFAHQFHEPGCHALAVRASGDRLDVDNTRWLVANVKDRVRVLCVGSSHADTRYIADALDPVPGDASAIVPTQITEGELAQTELAGFDCVFLSNVAQLTAEDTARLEGYVRRGGGLAVFLGDRVDIDSYNMANAGVLLPTILVDFANETRFGLDAREYRHPIVAPFRGRERAGLLSTPVNRYVRSEILDQPNEQEHSKSEAPSPVRNREKISVRGEVALAMPNGDPLIVTASLGQGQVVLFATAGSMASIDAATGQPWTTWPAWPSFLPIVRETLAYIIGGQQGSRQITVGQPIVIPAGQLPPTNDSPSLVRPDGRTVPLSESRGGSASDRVFTYADTGICGIYTFEVAGESRQFAVNVDTCESDLARIDPASLPIELRTGRENSATDVSRLDGWQRAAWQRSLLWSAFALAMFELLLAWRLGRGNA